MGNGEDVLSFVLAHELGHIFYRHPGYGSATQGVKGIFDELRGVTALDRVQEQEADLLGIRVACQAGFDPNGALILMDKFAEQDPTANSFMKNHPAAIERRNYLVGEVRRCLVSQSRISTAPTTEVQPIPGKSIWHISETPGVKWEFEIGKGYIFGTRVLASRLYTGDYDLVDLKSTQGDSYIGVQRESTTFFPASQGGSAKVCQWEFAVEVTMTGNLIEGRWEGYPTGSRIDATTCQRTGERTWQSVAWVAE